MNRKKNYFSYLLSIIVTFLFASELFAQPVVKDIYPPVGLANQSFEINVTGSGLDDNTRVYIEYDSKDQNPIIGSLETPGTACGISIVDNTVYIADGYAGLQIIDASVPSNPKIVGNLNTSGYAYEVVVQNGIAYVADSWSGLQIINVSNPAQPQLISSLYTQDYAYDVAVQNNTAYIADRFGGLQVADISNLNNPEIIASCETGSATNLVINNNRIYIGDGNEGIKIIDVTIRTNPQLINTWDTVYPVYDLSVKDNILYFLEDLQSYGMLHAIDVSNPYALREIISDFIPGSPEQIEISSNTIYITMGLHGVETKSITNIKGISHIGIRDISGFVYDISSSNGMGYITSNDGLLIVSMPFEINSETVGYTEPILSFTVPALNLPGNYNFHFDDSYYTLTVSGAVTILDELPGLGIYPRYIDFGRSKIYEPADSGQNIVISNISERDILVENLYIESAYNSDFIISDNTCSGKTLKPDEKCYAKIVFAPEHLGKIETKLSIYAIYDQDNTPFITEMTLTGESYKGEIYRFERMFPVLKQRWYFDSISDIAVDSQNFVYITDNLHNTIMKYTQTGQFVTQAYMPAGYKFSPAAIEIDNNDNLFVTDVLSNYFYKFSSNGDLLFKAGGTGTGDGQLNYPSGIAVNNDSIYIAEFLNHRIQQFDAEGNYLKKWGEFGTENSEFKSPMDIAADSQNSVYVTDSENNRIQKFDSDGNFLKSWGKNGTGENEFKNPYGLAVDDNDVIYVSDYNNDRIQIFSSDGIFLKVFGEYGWEPGMLNGPGSIAVNNKRQIYVVNDDQRVQIFNTDGYFIDEWASQSSGKGKFRYPAGIAIDEDGFIYVADRNNDRIQKFSFDGRFVKEWGNYGIGDGEFDFPEGIAVSQDGYVYVTDAKNNRIQKFTKDGGFVAKWGKSGKNIKEFDRPTDIAIDNEGYIYVSDSNNHRIQKFTSEGIFIFEFGQWGNGTKEFYYPMGIAIDNTNHIYVSDLMNHRIQKFDSSGNYITQWGKNLNEDYFMPDGIAVDDYNYVYVTDSFNGSIKKYTSDGQFVGEFGEFGYEIGQLNYPKRLCIDKNGKIYITDDNSRVQVFKKINLTEGETKAIIVAGRTSENDNLWNTTQMCANFAYSSFAYQGFTKENIYYLSPDTAFDDVDKEATAANLEYAITQWAKDAKSLVVYMVDHGGKNTFHLNENGDSLSAIDLDKWLDAVQADIPGEVIVIYDGCLSGSFVSALAPPENKQRFVITSTSPEENAKFESQGSISFSFNFWNNVLNGLDIKESFTLAVSTINHAVKDQNPMIDSDGDGIANETEDYDAAAGRYIGNGTDNQSESPNIQSISAPQTIQDTSSAKIEAFGVTDPDGIVRVWAVIRPPNFDPEMFDEVGAIMNLPSVELNHTTDNNYEGVYEHFHVAAGTYHIAVYAMDANGNTCVPQFTTVSVTNPLKRRAVILAGGSQDEAFIPVIEKNTGSAYRALAFQGYPDEDIYLMSPVTIPGATIMPVQPVLSNLQDALTRWAAESTQDVVLYIIGKGGDSVFQMNSEDILTASQLNNWLGILQDKISGELVIIYDSCRSGSFLPSLVPQPDKKRIVISSSTGEQPACFLSDGDIAFSQYFWRYVLKGTNVSKAFIDAHQTISDSYLNQTPLLDDNGNGTGSEKGIDGTLAKTFVIGNGIMVAGDEPLIGTVSGPQTLEGVSSTQIWADNIIASEPLDKVWAVVIPPDDSASCEIKQISLEMYNDGTGKYTADCRLFFREGSYNILIYAKDTAGSVSDPKQISISQLIDIQAVKGDINGDGEANLTDAVIALRVMTDSAKEGDVRWNYPASGADIDGNSSAGMAEAIYLLQYVAQLQ